MDKRERELDELVDAINGQEEIKFPPIFEMYATLFSIATSVMLFLYPDMFNSSGGNLYGVLVRIVPQFMWAFLFLSAGMVKSVGLLINNFAMRILGLVMSSCLYLAFTIAYALNFPTIGSITFACMTVFSIISMRLVRHTALER